MDIQHEHDEANVIYTDGIGRQVQCSCKEVYFIDDPIDEPEVPSGGPD